MENVGALCFGLVVGWVTYRSLRRRKDGAALSDIAAVIGAVGGGTVTALFDSKNLFAFYCFGLAGGFFGYLLIAGMMEGKEKTASWMTDD